jgi:predicted nucleotidyltransferase
MQFGSYAEGAHTKTSDVDLIVEFLTPAVSLITLSSLKYRLEEELNTEVDIIHGPLKQDSFITLGKVVSVYEQ